jgi:hypothetical protein
MKTTTFWRTLMVGIFATGLSFLVACSDAENQQANLKSITVYKSPTCGCCTKWVSHLEESGFTVEAINRNDMESVKSEAGVPHQLGSCHTAFIDGYVIEGHVPAGDIKRLLEEKPDVAGLTVPGMPMGSPGMEGPRQDSYDVLTFSESGETEVFNRY